MEKTSQKTDLLPAQQITEYISQLADWRGKLLARVRALVREADPAVVEDWKWETPVWADHGNVLAAAAFKDKIKLNFFKGAALEDPQGLFNAGLDAKASRAIDFSEGDAINESALKDLIRSAVTLNTAAKKK